MRVMIVRNAYSYDFGGAERLAVFLARELDDNHIEPLVTSAHDGVLKFAKEHRIPSARSPWLSHQKWSGLWLLLFPFYLVWQLYLVIWYVIFILRHHIDAVHLMSRDDFVGGTIAARLLHKPVIWTDCADLKFIYENHGIWYKNPVGKLVFTVSKGVRNVSVVSKNELRLIEASLGRSVPKNYTVIYMVGRDESVTPVNRKDAGIVFCATSRLVTDKGIGELIEAFNRIDVDEVMYRLWIIGDGPEADSFKAQAAHNKHIEFLGHVSNPLPQLAAADVYVHPTYHEGFSLGLAEAAMVSRAIIATKIGGNPEIIEHEKTGLLVDVKDVAMLTEAMRRLATNTQLRISLGTAARKKYLTKFDLKKVVKEQVVPLYEN